MPIDELVREHVLPGSLITHKGYARYGNLPNLKGGNGRNLYELHQPQEYLSKLEFLFEGVKSNVGRKDLH